MPATGRRTGVRGAGAGRRPTCQWIISVDLGDGDTGAQQREQLVGTTRDVTGAEDEDEVAAADDLEQGVGQALAALDETHVEVPAALQRLEERLAADARDRTLAGRIALAEHQQVGVVEGAEELVEEIARAGVAVRLEGDHQPAVEAFAGGPLRGADLLRVVAVFVHDEDVALLATHLEAAVDAAEL